MKEKKDRKSTAVSFRPDVLDKADRIVNEGLLPGVNNRSALIEYALIKVFREVFKEDKGPDMSVAPHVLTMDRSSKDAS